MERIINKWKKAIELTLTAKLPKDYKDRPAEGCGQCAVFYKCGRCNDCPLDFFGSDDGCCKSLPNFDNLTWCQHAYGVDPISSMRADWSNRKHFWKEFSMSNPELNINM